MTTKKLRLRTCETWGTRRRNLQRRSVQQIPACGIRHRQPPVEATWVNARHDRTNNTLQLGPSRSFFTSRVRSVGPRLPTVFASVPPLRLPVLGTGALAELMSHRKRRCCSTPPVVSGTYCLILALALIFHQETRKREQYRIAYNSRALGGVGGAERAASNLLAGSH